MEVDRRAFLAAVGTSAVYDGSPVDHMWRTIAHPNRPL